MDISEVKRIISEENLIDHDAIKAKTSACIAQVVTEKANSETGKIDFSDAKTVIEVLCQVVSNTIIQTTQEVFPTVLSVCIANIKDTLKAELRDEIMSETKDYVNQTTAKVNSVLTQKMVRLRCDMDMKESYDRRLNIVLSGVVEEPGENRSPLVTTDLVVKKLADINCNIAKEDISTCHRIYRKNTSNSSPNIIMTRFISQQVRDKALSFNSSFKDPSAGRYLNEDMSPMQRSLFSYLRNKDDLILKKTVGFKDGYIIFLTKANEHKTRGWSRIRNVFDLDGDLKVDFSDIEVLKDLGLADCAIDLSLD